MAAPNLNPPGVAPVPEQLATPILVASQQYGVPPDLLAGIWRNETGGKFPNPYANGLGYGGEFGTAVASPFGPASAVERITEPPLQQQANTSASVLAGTLRSSGGDVARALSAYSGGGYTSVPGETTFGNFSGGYQTPQASPASASGGTSSSGFSGFPTNLSPSNITGSIDEAALRLIELFAAAVLLYVGLRSLFSALQAGAVSGPLLAGGAAVGSKIGFGAG